MNDEAVKKRIEQRAKLNKYYNRYKIDHGMKVYTCVLCDKKFDKDEYQKFKQLDNYGRDDVISRRDGVICKECMPVCPYCGKDATNGLVSSAFEDEETLECYGEIFLFCTDCQPSCCTGSHMGYYHEPCEMCEEDENDHECDCEYCDYCERPHSFVEPRIKQIRRIKVDV